MDKGWLYLLRCGWYYKIGVSNDVQRRIASLQTASPYLIELVQAIHVSRPYENERELHELFLEQRVNGEWFEFTHEHLERFNEEMLRIAYMDALEDLSEEDWGLLEEDRDLFEEDEEDCIFDPPQDKRLPEKDYQPGDKVRHAQLGTGIVIKVMSFGDGLIVDTSFNGQPVTMFVVPDGAASIAL